MKKLVIFAIGSYVLLMFAGMVFAQASAGRMTAERCSACHSTARICEKLGNRTPEVWLQTVERMKSNGAKLSDADVTTVAEYLATAKPGAKLLCGGK
ncbi:hypothetical protein [Humidesulfovibrio sp.]|uniref:hypothetical protein n=1 Tax=Humidesulfovibrio sp. TaxID=2910988 RepID=UPI002D80D23A|nr:hypothetical protein [Humidesulfovibrio sp.]